MDAISALETSVSPQPSRSNSFSDLGSEDFLKLLIMQLSYQDPMEPVDNAELMQQISSIRDIELSNKLTESLQSLTGQQRFASASSLIGQYVTAPPGEDGLSHNGIVVGVRFTQSGRPMLQLAGGDEVAMEQVSTIESPLQVARSLMGQGVIGVDARDASSPEAVEGVVTGVRMGEQGEVLLELDTGQDLRFRDVIGTGSLAAV